MVILSRLNLRGQDAYDFGLYIPIYEAPWQLNAKGPSVSGFDLTQLMFSGMVVSKPYLLTIP
jgi:hypothetical protein